ncbi:hypothetical protein HPB50_013964 [Hyalomma asiaticum]|uniref:Uncharacterized protein n=1 Tax=Hyalomma asiaticum TaxID=266040 RepID=A0ACB7SGT7_HYAAI|nr:hypothetical protein HPB50_013964 [Hyalomma asiaticum]
MSQESCTFLQAAGGLGGQGPGHGHSHGGPGGHTHELMDGPGSYVEREALRVRDDWDQRAFTVGVGGPVGSGKTALMLALCRKLREKHSVCAVTNDIFTKEDWEFLCRNEALSEERMRAIETGGCPHAAIREVYFDGSHRGSLLCRISLPSIELPMHAVYAKAI